MGGRSEKQKRGQNRQLRKDHNEIKFCKSEKKPQKGSAKKNIGGKIMLLDHPRGKKNPGDWGGPRRSEKGDREEKQRQKGGKGEIVTGRMRAGGC